MPKLVIRSEDRLNRSTTTSTNFQVQLPRVFEFNKCRLESIQMPMTVYNITSANNTISLNGSTNAQIVNGYYDINSLISALNTALSSLSLTFSLSSVTNKVTITSGVGNFSIEFGNSNNMWRELGFLQTTYSGSSAYTAPNCPSLERPICFQIQIPELNLLNYSSGGAYYTFGFTSNVSFGSMVDWFSTQTYEQVSKQDNNQCFRISTISVRLLQSCNTVADLNGSEWQFTLDLC